MGFVSLGSAFSSCAGFPGARQIAMAGHQSPGEQYRPVVPPRGFARLCCWRPGTVPGCRVRRCKCLGKNQALVINKLVITKPGYNRGAKAGAPGSGKNHGYNQGSFPGVVPFVLASSRCCSPSSSCSSCRLFVVPSMLSLLLLALFCICSFPPVVSVPPTGTCPSSRSWLQRPVSSSPLLSSWFVASYCVVLSVGLVIVCLYAPVLFLSVTATFFIPW